MNDSQQSDRRGHGIIKRAKLEPLNDRGQTVIRAQPFDPPDGVIYFVKAIYVAQGVM